MVFCGLVGEKFCEGRNGFMGGVGEKFCIRKEVALGKG